jgi:uncharacterized membrane protein
MDVAKALAYLRKNGASIAIEALVNFIGPFLIFRFAKPDLGEVNALIASSAPPIIWSLIEFARKRRVDAVSMLVLAGIVLSLLAFLGGGSVRLLQLREKLVTALIGLVFLGSAAIGRPLIYQLARASVGRRSPDAVGAFDALRDNSGFRRTMTILTVVWGFGLVGEAGLAALLVVSLPVQTYLLVGPIMGYSVAGLLAGWTFWYSRRQQRKGEARRQGRSDAVSPEVHPSSPGNLRKPSAEPDLR